MVGATLDSGLPNVLSRLHPLDYEEAVRYWTRSRKEDEEDEAERQDEALINRQARRDQESQVGVKNTQERRDQGDQVQVNHTQEGGSEDQEEPRRGRITEDQRRRRRNVKRWVHRHRERQSQLQQTLPAHLLGYLQMMSCWYRKNSPRRMDGSPKSVNSDMAVCVNSKKC
jgi:hypothetical protein